jgi:hypothetical protein
MTATTHQTIKLSKGKHAHPGEGACVMELASMLAGEPFTDRPKSVCPVISSFLMTYNDNVGDERRQVLYACAANVVGTRGSRAAAQARAQYLLCLLTELRLRRHPWSRFLPRRRAAGRWLETVAARTARLMAGHEDELDVDVCHVVDDLVALGSEDQAPALSPRVFHLESGFERMVGLW